MLFSETGLSAELLRAVADQGYEKTTPIQAKAIPLVLEGRDLMAGAQTGTGKTAGFTLPILHQLQADPRRSRRIRVLILTPTRELAAQVAESVRTYGRYLPFKTAVIFGGVGFQPQKDKLRRGVDIVVATPGRLLDHLGQRTIRLDGVETLVLDEADRMLDMGFIHDIRKVMQALPAERQSLLFSATFSPEIRSLARDLLDDPAETQVTPRNTAAESVQQIVHPVDRNRKRALLAELVRDGDWRQVLVFTRTKHGANRLAQQLSRDGLSATAIHGNKSQAARTRALAEFKRGEVRILVATDIAARGLDIDRLPHVVNYELPHVAEDYVHRIGRTGRAGRGGHAVSLVCIDERKLLIGIERLLRRNIEQEIVPGFEPDTSIAPQPIFRGQGHGPKRDARQGQGPGPRRKPNQRRAGDARPHAGRASDPRRDDAPRRDRAHGERSWGDDRPRQARKSRHGQPGGERSWGQPRPQRAENRRGERPAYDDRPGSERPQRGRPGPQRHANAGSRGPREPYRADGAPQRPARGPRDESTGRPSHRSRRGPAVGDDRGGFQPRRRRAADGPARGEHRPGPKGRRPSARPEGGRPSGRPGPRRAGADQPSGGPGGRPKRFGKPKAQRGPKRPGGPRRQRTH